MVEQVLLNGNTHCVIQLLMRFNNWSTVPMRLKCNTMAHMNACCLHTVCAPSNESAIIVGVEREPWGSLQYCTRIGAIPTTVSWSTSWQTGASILLHEECTSVSRWSSSICKSVNGRWPRFYNITSGYRIMLMLSKNVGLKLLHC
jgi:hypothetical protein